MERVLQRSQSPSLADFHSPNTHKWTHEKQKLPIVIYLSPERLRHETRLHNFRLPAELFHNYTNLLHLN